MTKLPPRVGVAAALVATALTACGGRTAPPPEPGTSFGIAPDLRGRRIIVLPVQRVIGVAGDPDAELAFGLNERGGGVEWIHEPEIAEALRRAPGVATQTRGLPVGQFTVAEVQRIGDPLYGVLRRMAALVNAEGVLLPIQASFEPSPGGTEPKVRLTTALIEIRTGRVVWFSVLEGGAFEPGDPRGLASAVEEVARTLLWYAGE